MQEVDINTLVNKYNELNENIPNDIIIVGKISRININYKYDELDLSKVECNEIFYWNQEGESIKNHILSNSLKYLYCCNNKLTSFTNVQLPNSLKELYCYRNNLTSFANAQLPNSLEILNCSNNKMISFADTQLPNSLKVLHCDYNQLTSLPDFTYIDHEIELSFIQNSPIEYIPYNKNIQLCDEEDNKIIIEGYPNNPITNQQELDQYMDYIKNYQLNRIKSARK